MAHCQASLIGLAHSVNIDYRASAFVCNWANSRGFFFREKLDLRGREKSLDCSQSKWYLIDTESWIWLNKTGYWWENKTNPPSHSWIQIIWQVTLFMADPLNIRSDVMLTICSSIFARFTCTVRSSLLFMLQLIDIVGLAHRSWHRDRSLG